MQLNERCVKCGSSMVYLADYEGISIDKMLGEASFANLTASQIDARNPKSKILNKVENSFENKVEPVKKILQKSEKNSE